MPFVHVYTGNGKGKTTCAVGLAIRALGAGLKVAFIQFDKGFDGENEHYNERHILRELPGIDLFPYGLERMMPDGKFRFQNTDDDLVQARAGLNKATEIMSVGSHQMVIMDELITCTGTGLLEKDDIMNLLNQFRENPSCELVLTGRSAWEELIAAADLVTEMTLVKHYWYEHQIPARPGVDY